MLRPDEECQVHLTGNIELILCPSVPLRPFQLLLHLKLEARRPFFVCVSQECESGIKRIINLEARRQSCSRSQSSAWDREERRESERQRERKLNGK